MVVMVMEEDKGEERRDGDENRGEAQWVGGRLTFGFGAGVGFG